MPTGGGATTMMSVWLEGLPNLPSGTAQRMGEERRHADTAMIRGKKYGVKDEASSSQGNRARGSQSGVRGSWRGDMIGR